jgi:hypothetical protein
VLHGGCHAPVGWGFWAGKPGEPNGRPARRGRAVVTISGLGWDASPGQVIDRLGRAWGEMVASMN